MMADFYYYAAEKSGVYFADADRITNAPVSERLCENGYHTGKDWGLYWTDFSVTAPEVEQYFVDVPGRHGLLDFSEVLMRHPVYKNATLTAQFVAKTDMANWHTLYRTIRRALHGRRMCIAADTDPQHCFVGRCTVASEMVDAVHAVFTIAADIVPYTYGNAPLQYGFLWDFTAFYEELLPEPIIFDENGEASVRLHSNLIQTAHAAGTKIIFGNLDIYTEQACTFQEQGNDATKRDLIAMGEERYCNRNVYNVYDRDVDRTSYSNLLCFSNGTPGTQIAVFCRYQELL